ncbi:hypothetical protein G7054_g10828 [Neopestalotiopsis clavispora]|nr:hypothetical protein G7054_g10828 [Neopestalotiopsis clavispora]
MSYLEEVKDATPSTRVDTGANSVVEVDSKTAQDVELLDDGVRISVPSTDEDIPASTFRAWTLGILFTMITNGLNQLFTMHNPPMVIAAFLVVLLSYPIGTFLARVLPARKFTLFGYNCSLNPGPFNHKEHTIINNRVVNQVFGSTSGLDLIPITFDWNQITAYLTSPLPVPTWAIANLGVAIVVVLWVITPAVHWSNTWYGHYVPVSSSSIFDNTGSAYSVAKVINADFTLNEEAYHAYSPIFLSTTTLLADGLGLASVVAILVHSYLHHRHEIWAGLRATFKPGSVPVMEKEDIHTRMMKAYKPTPTWWYAASLVASIALAIGFLEGYATGVRWWAMIICLVIQLITVVPIAIMAALCNQIISLAVPGGIMGGGLYAGNMEAAILFKKVPPRVVFAAQAVGIIVSWITQTGVNTWALNHIAGVCTTSMTYICPIARSFESSIIIWGLIGPKRFFGPESMYSGILWWLIPGALLPILARWFAKRYPQSLAKHIHIPLMMSATASIPPATAINFIPWTLVGLFFNWFVKRRWNDWWLKYNYMLSAGLDGALGVTTLLIFFCLNYPGVVFNWWGNVGAFETADVAALPLKSVNANETFGPSSWP